MSNKRKSKHLNINEESGERTEIPTSKRASPERGTSQGEKLKRNSGVADDIRVLSALSFVLGGSFLSMFNSFMNHPPAVSSSCFKNIENSLVFKLYIVIATVGFMWLFGAGLICYELFRLFNEKNISEQWNYFKICCVLVFSGIIINFAGHVICLYITHCEKILLLYLLPLVLVFLASLAIIGYLNFKLNSSKK